MEKFEVGKIVNTIGLKGEMRVVADANNKQRLMDAKTVFVDGAGYQIANCRVAGKHLAIKFVGFDAIEKVEHFKGKDVFMDLQGGFELLEDEYFVDDLVGCQIVAGDKIATITGIENYGGGDIITFVMDGKEHQIPFIMHFFDEIDVANKKIIASQHFFEGVV